MNRTASAWAQATPDLQGTSDTHIGKIKFDLGFLFERVKLRKEFSKTFI
jgi:hypothetical protein